MDLVATKVGMGGSGLGEVGSLTPAFTVFYLPKFDLLEQDNLTYNPE